jgi:3D-(3,5/4)-trihydroxycyclohexane-1,2-dione acylhydrolase (decyclizing)
MKTVRLTVAQALLRFLDRQYVAWDGCETKFVTGIFGVFGHGCVTGIGQALEQGGHELVFYQGHNEQGMAHAATAYARQNRRRKIIACTSSIGPGALNMVTAAGTATANRIPLLLLPGDTFATRQPDPVLQQLEFPDNYTRTANDAFRAVCRYWDRVSRPEQLMTAVIQAMRVLTDPADTGAVCLCLPQDVEAEAYDYPEFFFARRVWHLDRRPPAEPAIARAAELIRSSQKPLLICGGGIHYSEAWAELQRFAEQFDIPICETQAGKGLIAWDHPLNLGGIGVTGGRAANRAARDADLIIAAGTRLTDFTTCSKWGFQNPDVRVISLNISAFDAIKLDALPVVGDAKLSLQMLIGQLGQAGWTSRYGSGLAGVRQAWQDEIDAACADVRANGLSQTRVLGLVNGFMQPGDIAVGASGSLPGDMQRLWRGGHPGTYHVEYAFSCMGYEVCGALGVKMACPDREVYAFLGDGSYLMLHSELFTAVQEGLKINLVILDNAGWGCIEHLQNSQGTDTFGTVFRARSPGGRLDGALLPVDFAANARSYGAVAYTIRNEHELLEALADARSQERPCVFDIKVLPGSMSGGCESWWRVGVAAVSESSRVAAAYADMAHEINKARPY